MQAVAAHWARLLPWLTWLASLLETHLSPDGRLARAVYRYAAPHLSMIEMLMRRLLVLKATEVRAPAAPAPQPRVSEAATTPRVQTKRYRFKLDETAEPFGGDHVSAFLAPKRRTARPALKQTQETSEAPRAHSLLRRLTALRDVFNAPDWAIAAYARRLAVWHAAHKNRAGATRPLSGFDLLVASLALPRGIASDIRLEPD